MNRNLLWRGILILAVAIGAVALAYPLNKKINLGLDLQGGMHLVLQVHTEDALRAETDSDMSRLLNQTKDAKMTGLQGHRISDTSFEIAGVGPDSRDAVDHPGREVPVGVERTVRGRARGLHHEDREHQQHSRSGGHPGQADDRQPHQRVRRRGADHPGGVEPADHRRAARRRRSRARPPADQEHGLPRVPHRPLPRERRRRGLARAGSPGTSTASSRPTWRSRKATSATRTASWSASSSTPWRSASRSPAVT